MKTVVLTSDNHSWLLKGFFRQWIRYAGSYNSLDIEVAGFTKPSYIPKCVPFVKIGKFEDYPVDKWSDAVIKYLEGVKDELVLILLEDYWMMRPLAYGGIYAARKYMADHKDVIRFDLAADRMFNKAAVLKEYFQAVDICECKGDYSLSFQASIYRVDLLLQVMKAGENPWQAELNGTQRLNALPYRVVGSYQWPMQYFIAMCKGKLDTVGAWMYPARTLRPEDWEDLGKHGCLSQIQTEAISAQTNS
jgi:hypothetical protein